MDVLQGQAQFTTLHRVCKARPALLNTFQKQYDGGIIVEELIRKVLNHYMGYVSEAELYERWLSSRENPEIRDALTLLQMKITTVQSWFNLLNADERFVVQKHLIEELEWPRVAFTFTEKWKGEFNRTERTLVHYQASALRKISGFCETHRKITLSLFGDLLSSDLPIEK